MRSFFFLQGSNAEFVYQIAASASAVPFSINPSFGTLTVSGTLDYETASSYNFTVSHRHRAVCVCVCVCVGGGGGGGGEERNFHSSFGSNSVQYSLGDSYTLCRYRFKLWIVDLPQ